MQLPPLAFIGGGNMATAMIRGLARLPQPPPITVAEPRAEQRALLADLGVRAVADNLEALGAARVVVLAIKPQIAPAVVPALAAGWTPGHLLVSILAGTTTARLAAWLPAGARIVRAMPNTPLAVGEGMVGLCPGRNASEDDLRLAEALFAPAARVLRIGDEARMDALTAVSGSGPAYVFRTVEAWLAAAERLGFTRTESELLVGQTLRGAVAYLEQQGIAQAAALRHAVTSPGGTTAAALAEFEAAGFTELWCRALEAAERRGRELASS